MYDGCAHILHHSNKIYGFVWNYDIYIYASFSPLPSNIYKYIYIYTYIYIYIYNIYPSQKKMTCKNKWVLSRKLRQLVLRCITYFNATVGKSLNPGTISIFINFQYQYWAHMCPIICFFHCNFWVCPHFHTNHHKPHMTFLRQLPSSPGSLPTARAWKRDPTLLCSKSHISSETSGMLVK